MTDDQQQTPNGGLRDALREALSDPVPAELIERSVALGSWITMDEELASLTHRANGSAELAGVRGDDLVATFTFESPRLVIEVEIEPGSRSLTGQILPPVKATVRLMTADRTVGAVEADSQGVFRLQVIPTVPVCLVIGAMPDRGPAVRTDWIII